MTTRVGILGIGTHLPPEVRTNDWWSVDVVERWMQSRAKSLEALRMAPAPKTRGIEQVVDAMLTFGSDPFQGSVERHVMGADTTSYDLEECAARDALTRAGIDPTEIGLLFTHTLVPEFLINNSACVLHGRLRMSERCFVMQTDATAYSFLAQLTLAQHMIAGGHSRYALLVQSCGVSRLIEPEDPIAPLFGDGATAVVIGPVRENRGVLASVNRTETSHPFWMGAAARTGRWYDEGRGTLYCPDPVGASHVFLDIPDQAKEATSNVLASAELHSHEVNFFAAHQGMPWLRELAQSYAGLGSARTLDTFPFAASLFAANIPLVLRTAEDAGHLHDDDIVMLFGGGTGVTYGATLLRWGR